MWHSRFLGAILAVLALLGFVENQAVLAAYPTSSELPMGQSQGARGVEGAFQLAIMGGSTAPSAMPTEKPVEVAPVVIPQGESVEKGQPETEKPAIVKPKATPKKASKPKRKKVKKAKSILLLNLMDSRIWGYGPQPQAPLSFALNPGLVLPQPVAKILISRKKKV